jgi:hypothetical protein
MRLGRVVSEAIRTGEEWSIAPSRVRMDLLDPRTGGHNPHGLLFSVEAVV